MAVKHFWTDASTNFQADSNLENMYAIYCSSIWFNYVKSKKRSAFDSFINLKWNSLFVIH